MKCPVKWFGSAVLVVFASIIFLSPAPAHAASVGLFTLHQFGMCPTGIPTGPITPESLPPCNPNVGSTNINVDGAFPTAPLTLAQDGRMFGITLSGVSSGTCSVNGSVSACYPPYDTGGIFSIDAAGRYDLLYKNYPHMFGSLLSGPDGNLYGVDPESWLFQMTPAGQYSKIVATMYLNSRGVPVQTSDGSFYAVDYSPDDGAPYGAIFTCAESGALTTLHVFSAVTNGVNEDGEFPWAGLAAGNDGNLYGTTTKGGAYGFGTVFQLTPSGQLTTLHSFDGVSDGSQSHGQLLEGSDGDFYGTAYAGGSYGSGTIFKIATDGTFTVLHSFKNSDGANPKSGLVLQGGTFYGATSNGGQYGSGTIFRMTSRGVVSTLYSFSNLAAGVNSDGAIPNGVTLGQDGNLYGTAELGGANGTGAIFELITHKPTLIIRLKPAWVSASQNTTLTWSSTSATACTASGAWSGAQSLAGSIIVSQTSAGSYSYTLTCTGPAGSVTRTAKLTVR